MDDDAIALVRQLCTQAGVIMEDASARAVLVGGLGAGELAEVVRGSQGRSWRVRWPSFLPRQLFWYLWNDDRSWFLPEIWRASCSADIRSRQQELHVKGGRSIFRQRATCRPRTASRGDRDRSR